MTKIIFHPRLNKEDDEIEFSDEREMLRQVGGTFKNDLKVISLGMFKGTYDTRKFRCFKRKCHTSNLKNCQYCKYLPYTSSPLRNSDYYCENIEIKDPTLKYRKTSKPQNNLDNLENHLVWLLSDIIDDFSIDHKARNKNENKEVTEKYTLIFTAFRYPNFYSLENVNVDRALSNFVKITNKVKPNTLVLAFKKKHLLIKDS